MAKRLKKRPAKSAARKSVKKPVKKSSKRVAKKASRTVAKKIVKKAAKKVTKKAAPKSGRKPALESNVVVVPRPAQDAYNPDRPLSKNSLLQYQVRHFQEVEKSLSTDQQTGHDPETILTEGHAAEYLRKMTARLHPQARHAARVSKAPGK
jgi:hypothetical protein